MAELPSGLLEACVVVGASSDKLRDVYQVLIFSYTHFNMATLINIITVHLSGMYRFYIGLEHNSEHIV